MHKILLVIAPCILLAACAGPFGDLDSPRLLNQNAPFPAGVECFDSDASHGDGAHLIKGFVHVDGIVEYDSCRGDSLDEQRCIFGTRRAVRVICPLGCRNGACIRADGMAGPNMEIPHVKVGWCSDADGEDIFLASSATSAEKVVADVCKKRYETHAAVVESCDAPDCVVVEAVCSEGFRLATIEFECRSGCVKGACQGKAETI